MDYFDWLHSLDDLLVKELEKELEKGFIRDGRMAWEAAKHSEAMMLRNSCYHAPSEYWGGAESELVGAGYTSYKHRSIEQAVKERAYVFLISGGHYQALRFFSVIGAGIAIKEICFEEAIIYAVLRLRR